MKKNSEVKTKKEESPTKKLVGKIISAICTVIVLALLAAVAYLLICNAKGILPKIGNHSYARIISGSMEPEIPTGSYILIESIDSAEVKEGDVIAFYSRDPSILGKINTHRVVEVLTNEDGSREFVTKGDNNSVKDRYNVKSEDIAGRYVKIIPFLTTVTKYLFDKTIFFFIIIIPALALIIICFLDIRKKAKQVAIDKLVAEEVKRLAAEAAKNGTPEAVGTDTTPDNKDGSQEA